MTPTIEPDQLRRRIAETVAWCRLRGSLADPENSLRTPVLRPTNRKPYDGIPHYFHYDWGYQDSYSTGILAVSELAEKRAEMLRAESASDKLPTVDVTQGRLLIADPENSLDCGLSEDASSKFFDQPDVPAWDTWLCFVHEERVVSDAVKAFPSCWSARPFASYLLCWIPSEFLPLAEEGIAVNPVECLIWARDYKPHGFDTATMRWLEAQDLLW